MLNKKQMDFTDRKTILDENKALRSTATEILNTIYTFKEVLAQATQTGTENLNKYTKALTELHQEIQDLHGQFKEIYHDLKKYHQEIEIKDSTITPEQIQQLDINALRSLIPDLVNNARSEMRINHGNNKQELRISYVIKYKPENLQSKKHFTRKACKLIIAQENIEFSIKELGKNNSRNTRLTGKNISDIFNDLRENENLDDFIATDLLYIWNILVKYNRNGTAFIRTALSDLHKLEHELQHIIKHLQYDIKTIKQTLYSNGKSKEK